MSWLSRTPSIVATSLIRTRCAAALPVLCDDPEDGAQMNISARAPRHPNFIRAAVPRLENDQTFQEAHERVLAVRVVIDNSLSNYFQLKIRDCGREHLIVRIHVAGPHKSAKTDHLCLLIERHLSL